MEITELRIGSWVVKNDLPAIIEGILDGKTVKINGVTTKLVDIKPMYITPELMDRNWVNGWKCEDDDEFGTDPTFVLDSSRLLLEGKEGLLWYLFRTMRNDKKVLLAKLNYVHELQNVLVALKSDCDIDCNFE